MSEIQSLIKKFKEQMSFDDLLAMDRKMPDIITFCYDKHYLNFSGKRLKLFPMQQIILKTFYRGQRGNEDLTLAEDELELLKKEKMQDVIDKYSSGALFRELVLVLGRRSGKDFMTGIIAAYEAMRLLECPGGNPYRYYDIAEGNPMFILTVANSSDQAKVLFNEIKTHMVTSEYFRDKIGGIESEKICLLTPADKKHNKMMREEGFKETDLSKGNVVVMSGHSNSDSLLGKGYYILLFDEVASYKSNTSIQSGERLYSALAPGQVAFKRPILDKDGNLQYDEQGEVVTRLDSKIISISSPRGEEGILFKLYKNAPSVENMLAFRLPTWKVNRGITYQMLRKENQFMNENDFNMEFGAEFSGVGGEKYIPDAYVDTAIDIGRQIGLDQREYGVPGVLYYAHLDPASTSHNYGLVVLHTEERVRWVEKDDGTKKKEKVKFFVVDHIKQWQPSGNRQINVNEVDEYIMSLSRRFKFAMVSYDAWNSLASVQKLRSKGIPSKTTPFRKQYKMFIYNHLEHIMVNRCLALPHKGQYSQDLEMELKCLKRIYSGTGFSIEPDPEAAKTTDDLCDALAGACGVAIEDSYNGYPKGATVFMPQSQFASQQWKMGQGSARNHLRISNRKFGI
jgi:hypothetical protein